MLKNRYIKISIFSLTALLVFVFGEALGIRYATVREMQLYEQVISGNLPILASCKHEQCSDALQKMLVQENDLAMSQYLTLERMNGNLVSQSFWYAVWPVMFVLFSNQGTTSSDRLREHYMKLQCGLDGVICASAAPKSSG